MLKKFPFIYSQLKDFIYILYIYNEQLLHFLFCFDYAMWLAGLLVPQLGFKPSSHGSANLSSNHRTARNS